MDGQSIAHELPELYRALLDRVAALERSGLRRDAAGLRTAAIAAYSFRWDDPAKRRLVDLLSRAERLLDGVARRRRVGRDPISALSTGPVA